MRRIYCAATQGVNWSQRGIILSRDAAEFIGEWYRRASEFSQDGGDATEDIEGNLIPRIW